MDCTTSRPHIQPESPTRILPTTLREVHHSGAEEARQRQLHSAQSIQTNRPLEHGGQDHGCYRSKKIELPCRNTRITARQPHGREKTTVD
ncbi:hypothetical protein CLIM01_14967 [Colletotrichum limetticola]|uniref:Uncharacterized protein n=1 Tax=Colletotrichum limetticola TaxID=1209924 RepID=A0ABQ9P979_9PEZI|nr:hypothetical protein CLIM01_14967 [Colletotrichum limetticola]